MLCCMLRNSWLILRECSEFSLLLLALASHMYGVWRLWPLYLLLLFHFFFLFLHLLLLLPPPPPPPPPFFMAVQSVADLCLLNGLLPVSLFLTSFQFLFCIYYSYYYTICMSPVTGISSWYFSWTGGDPHRSGFKLHIAVLSVLCVMFQV